MGKNQFMLDALPLEKIREFMKSVPPFHILSDSALDALVQTIIIEYFSKGEVILSPDGPPTQFLYIIRSGGIRSLLKGGESDRESIQEYREEGEWFGYLPLLSGEPSPFTVVAEEDTFCYLIKKEVFNGLLDTHPDLFLAFTGGVCKETHPFSSDSTPQSLAEMDLDVEQVLLTGRIKDVMHAAVLTCSAEETVVGVARKMTDRGVSSAVVVDEAGVPMGIVTDGDFRSKIVASRRIADAPVSGIMSQPIRAISPESFCFEAIISMIMNRINYLPVMSGPKLHGIVSRNDLMLSQGNTPLTLVRGLQQATSIEEVVSVRDTLDRAMLVILRRGGMAKDVCELITGLNDLITQRLIALAIEAMFREGHGRPPVPFAWLALGSEGRREQTLRTDQDNAIIFADSSAGKGEEEQVYFLMLSEKVVSGLEMCGFPRCKGGVMAVNPRWCQPFQVWRNYFRHWIVGLDYPPEEVLETFIFFDYRTIYGQAELVTRMNGYVSDYLNERSGFLRDMAQNAVLHETPLGFFKRLVVRRSGEHKNRLNLKLDGLTPLIDAVRTLALDQRILQTNTLSRISALAEREVLTPAQADDLSDAYNVIMLARIRHHLNMMKQGKEPDNYVNPEDLTIIQRTALKEAFKTIDKLQNLLLVRYQLTK